MANQHTVSMSANPGRANLRDIAFNYFGAVVVIGFAYALFTHHPWLLKFYQHHHRVWFTFIALGYLAILPIYYATLPRGHTAKCWCAVRYVLRCWQRRPTEAERVALLAIFIKLFFLPMMVMWLVVHANSVVDYAQRFMTQPVFLPTGYWLLFNVVFFVDVLFFTVGYAVEHPRLGNEIQSVEPTLAGWFVTLACYPPFNDGTVLLLGWPTNDYPGFESFWVQTVACAVAVALLFIYASASVALGWKASNLTHRGIVTRGPYRWVRHPAYTAKNLSWWVGALPVIAMQWQHSVGAGVVAALGMAGWTLLYYFRAVTEERHLLRDPEYQAYCRQVRYRFIPSVW